MHLNDDLEKILPTYLSSQHPHPVIHAREQVKQLRVKPREYFFAITFFIKDILLTDPACILGTHERLVAGNLETSAQLSRLP